MNTLPAHEETESRLNALLAGAGMDPLEPGQAEQFAAYLLLLVRWNARMNLTAIRGEGEILRRHFVESIFCARAIPAGASTVLDFGSGAGFPGIPIALLRPDLSVTLAESQQKKAAFLQEAGRVLGAGFAVHAGRAEALGRKFDCVTLRAVDRMAAAVQGATDLVAEGGRLLLLTTVSDAEQLGSGPAAPIRWEQPVPLPYSTERVLLAGVRVSDVPSGLSD